MERDTFKISSKFICRFLLVFGLFFFVPQQAEAQFFKKLAKKAKQKIDREAEKRAERRVNKKIDKEFDKAEDALDGKKKEKGKKVTEKNKDSIQQSTTSKNGQTTMEIKQPNVVWSKFDFIPGDTVIFEDSPSASEENGEFPSRWDLVKGQVEIANIDGENVMMFIDGSPMIVPFLKNSNEDYLPEIFTIEFDFYKPVKGNRISVYLADYKNQKKLNPDVHSIYMDISSSGVGEKLAKISGVMPGIDYRNANDARWIHVSIAFTKGKLKVYMDDTRVINIPHYSGNPSGLTLQAYFAELEADKAFYFKNIRIAKGGVKYYDRVLSEGKIIVNGIKFDTNNATLKPESMGPINKIHQLMQKQPDLNFSVEGHTDADGNDANNQTLSEARGKSVMNKLIAMGISANRLKSNGFGESKPLDNNSTPEGKANNRRVEFVKFAGSSNQNSNNGVGSSSTFGSFKRAEKTIFVDGPSRDEKVHKVPSKWRETRLNNNDNSETVDFKGEKVIRIGERTGIAPIVLENGKDYLPDNFTLEFDASFSANAGEQRYWVHFYDHKTQKDIVEHAARSVDLTLTTFAVMDGYNEGILDNKNIYDGAPNLVWRHISISYKNNNLDIYYDGKHLLSSPNIEGNFIGINISRSTFSDTNRYIKNIHLATNNK